MPLLLIVLGAQAQRLAWFCQGLAVGLARDGRDCVLVDTDLTAPALSRRVGLGEGHSFQSMLSGVQGEARPLAVPHVPLKGSLSWLPARSLGEGPNTALAMAPPPGPWAALPAALRSLSTPEGLVLLSAPSGAGALCFGLTCMADAVLVLLDEDEDNHAALSDLLRNTQALRDPAPALFLVATGPENPALRALTLRHWHSQPDRWLSLDLDETSPAWPALASALCQQLGAQHPDPQQRYRRAVEDADVAAAERAFAACLHRDREGALSLFESLCRPKGSRLEGAMGALLVLAEETPSDPEALRRVLGVAVQRLQLERPSAWSQVVLAVAEGLLAELSPHSPHVGSLLLQCASARLHVAHWMRGHGQDPGELVAKALEGITRASGMSLSSGQHVYLAVVCGTHAEVAGSMATFPLATAALARAEQSMRDKAKEWIVTVYTRFAIVSQRDDLWQEVLVQAEHLTTTDPGRGYYMLAIAHAQQGRPAEALEALARSINATPSLARLALADMDLAPLFKGAGHPDFDFYPPRNPQ